MPESQAQVGLAGAVCSGRNKQPTRMSKKVACEIVHKMKGRKMSELGKKRYYERARERSKG